MVKAMFQIVVLLVVFVVDLGAGRFIATNSSNERVEPAACRDVLWCSIPIPAKSHFGFSSAIDKDKWDVAKQKARSGEQVLLSKVMPHFPHYLDFLDGDTLFRKYHFLADFFVDNKNDLTIRRTISVTNGECFSATTIIILQSVHRYSK